MKQSLFVILAAAVLTGCPKKTTGSGTQVVEDEDIWATGPEEPERRVPEGWKHIDLPSGTSDLRPNTSLALQDGSLWIAGSTLKIAQYQWLLRAPGLEEPAQYVYDPGRIIRIATNGTGGISAVGVLGGIPSDKAWFGNIDAFGEVSSRQTYLSDGPGRLWGVDSSQEHLILVGTVASELNMKGWMISADIAGSDRWKQMYGGDGDYAITWVDAREDGAVAIGRFRTLEGTDEAWYVRTDDKGEVAAERHWAPKTWTKLQTGAAHPTGDILAAGLVSSSELGPDDGNASLWIGRMTPSGGTTWDRFEREDVSEISQAVAWKGGLALVARTGALGTLDRRTWLVRSNDNGDVVWTTLNVPQEIDFAEVHAVTEDTLQFVAVLSDKDGVSWTSYPLVLKDDE